MTDVKHTPGPWYFNQKYCIGPRVNTYDQSDGMFHPLADVYGVNRDANARLIAAAPDLLAAAKRALNFIENTEGEIGCSLESGELLRAAIAKAEGRS